MVTLSETHAQGFSSSMSSKFMFPIPEKVPWYFTAAIIYSLYYFKYNTCSILVNAISLVLIPFIEAH